MRRRIKEALPLGDVAPPASWLYNAQATGYVVIEVVHITRWSILHGSPLWDGMETIG